MLLRLLMAGMVLTGLGSLASSAEPLAIGSRLEPLVDDYLIERLSGAELKLHAPTPRTSISASRSGLYPAARRSICARRMTACRTACS